MAKRVIALLGQPIVNEDGAASEAITPGMLVQGVTSIAKHASAGGVTPAIFALERAEMGQNIDSAYAIGDTVKVGSFGKGHRVNALIASGVATTAGTTYLESAGDGTLRAYTSGERLARSLETVTSQAGVSAALRRHRVEIL